MTVSLDWATPQVLAFMLVVARLSGLFLLAPVFSSRLIPVKLKIMAVMVLAATMTPMVAAGAEVPMDGPNLALMMFKESLIGLALGFAVAIVFSAVQIGAMMIDTSIGFAMANIVDPLSNSQASIFGSFYTMVATLAFLSVNGHHWLLTGFVNSFEAVPVDELPNFGLMLTNMQGIFGQLFVMAFQIAAPVLVTLLMVDVVLGLVSRAVPQMNVFFVGIPLKIAVGMAAVVVALPAFVNLFLSQLSNVMDGARVLAGA